MSCRRIKKMYSKKRKIGDIGEGIACRFLENKGYKIIEKNWWKPWGEIDIVAEKGGKTFFIEVKTVSFDDLPVGLMENDKRFNSYIDNLSIKPEDNIHPMKLKKLLRTIETYVLNKNYKGHFELHIALVYLDLRNKKTKVKIIEDVV